MGEGYRRLWTTGTPSARFCAIVSAGRIRGPGTAGVHEAMIGTGVPPAVPGLVLDRRLGSGEHGEVWRALDLGAVRTVAVQIGRPAAGAGAAAREAAQLRRIDHENVAHLRAVLDLPDGRRAVVLDLVPAGDLAGLVARRGALTTGEAVTLAVCLARALDHVHALGFVHGRLSAQDVLFAAGGRPVLAGVGVASLLAPTTPRALPGYPTPPDDVRALGEVVRFALTGGRPGVDAPGPLGGLVARCLAADAGARPSPTRVATLARDAGRAAPVVLDAGAAVVAEQASPAPPAADRRGRRRLRRPLTAGAALGGLALVGAAALAVRAGPDDSSSASSSASSSGASPAAGEGLDDVRGVVAALADARARAFGSAAEAWLGAVDAPASAALASDRAFVARLREAGVTLSGLGFDVADARVLEVDGDSAVVRARVTTSAYRQMRIHGSVARQVPQAPPRIIRLTLVRTGDGWRIAADG